MSVRRRSFLQSIAAMGASLSLPRALGGSRAFADASSPRRLIMFCTPNGTIPGWWSPTDRSTGACEWASGASPDLSRSRILAPLAPHRDNLLLVNGIDGPGHAHGFSQTLTGEGEAEGFDVQMERLLGPTRVGRIDAWVRPSSRGSGDLQEGHSAILRDGRSRSTHVNADIGALWDTVFGSFEAPAPDDSGPTPTALRRRATLEALQRRMSSVHAGATGSDRVRLERHLDTAASLLGAVDVGSSGMRPAMCGAIGAPAASVLPMQEQLAYLTRLVPAALACDAARVATILVEEDSSGQSFDWLRGDDFERITNDHHATSHGAGFFGGDNAERKGRQMAAINRWYAGQFKELLDQLQSIPDGSGTLLDSTTVIWMTENRDGSHSHQDMHFVLAGGGAGLRMNRYMRFSDRAREEIVKEHNDRSEYVWGIEGDVSYGNQYTTNDLFLSLLQAHGSDKTSFGRDGFGRGGLPELR